MSTEQSRDRVWDVKLYWADERGTFESGANTVFSAGTSPMWIIEEVARWRGVDLAKCTSIKVTSVEIDR